MTYNQFCFRLSHTDDYEIIIKHDLVKWHINHYDSYMAVTL